MHSPFVARPRRTPRGAAGARARPASATSAHGGVAISQHRLQQLGLDLAVALVGVDDRLDLVGELERLAVEDHQLLLDAQRVARAGELGLHRRRTVGPGTQVTRNRGECAHGARLRREALHPRLRSPGLLPEEDVRDRGRPDAGADGDDRRRQAADLRGHGAGGRARRRRARRPACWSTSSSAATSPSRPRRRA